MFESLESAPPGMRRGHGTCIASAMALLAAIAVLAIACEGPAVRAANNDDDQLALSSNDAGLDLAIGRALFERSWVSAPASTKSTDGLGPLYNARSRPPSHRDPRRQPMTASGLALPTAIIFKLTGPPSPYGAQLQTA